MSRNPADLAADHLTLAPPQERAARPVLAHATFRHEASLCFGAGRFLASVVPFVADGLAAGQPVLATLAQPRRDLLRSELGRAADRVRFVDMETDGRNPARMAARWADFAAAAERAGRPARGVSEPLGPGRRPAEIVECQLHEAMLNVTTAPTTPLWLRCVYDVAVLHASLIGEAARSHPALVHDGDFHASIRYAGRHHARVLAERDLAEPVQPVRQVPIGPWGLAAVRDEVRRRATAAGVGEDAAADLTLAVHELALSTLAADGARGQLRLWLEPDALVCEIHHPHEVADPSSGNGVATPPGRAGLGVWLADRLCDLVQVRSAPWGTRVRVTTWL